MAIKAIVCDVDGTLLNSNYEIPSKTLDILLRLQEEGIILILASGRSYTRLIDLAKVLKMDQYNGYLIDSNGTSIYDVNSEQRKIFGLLDSYSINKLNIFFANLNVEIQYVQDSSLYIYLTETILDLKSKIRSEMKLPEDYPWSGGEHSWFCDIRDAYPEQIRLKTQNDHPDTCNKIMITQEPTYLKFVKDSIERTSLINEFEVVFPNHRNLEITKKGINKGETLLILMNKLKISENEIIIFGDSENDLSMFQYSSYSIAMGNAFESVKYAADFITKDNNNDGIYEILMEFEANRNVDHLCKKDF